MKSPVRILTLMGMFAALTSETVQVAYIVFQTEPTTDPTIVNLSMVLMIIAASWFDIAYLEWKRKVNDAAAVGLFLIGSVGCALSFQFSNALVNAFFPRTYIRVLLFTNSLAVAVAGAYLPVIYRGMKRHESRTRDFAGQDYASTPTY